MPSKGSKITLGEYLFQRLRQLKVQSIFGLPGDFNLTLLDKIYQVEGLRWVGNANELNAGYAADGYARVKGLSCIVTTFGVGELSTINAIAGSYAEHVGVVHVVGIPSIAAQSKQLLLHHTLGNGDFTVFHKISSQISQTTTILRDLHSAPAEIDRVIREAYIHQRPVYIGFPSNYVDEEVPASLLKKPLDLSLQPNDPESEEEVVETILKMVSKAKNPIVLVDACAGRHNVKEETAQLIDITQFPVYVTPMGKGNFNEHNPRFGGVYVGSLSYPHVKEAVESADLVLSVGGIMSDFNTGSFSYSYKTSNIIELHSDYCKIKTATFPGVQMKFVLPKLLESIGGYISHYEPTIIPNTKILNTPANVDTPLTQSWLWTRFSSWLRPGDVVITETGTSSFGIIQTQFPPKTTGISQVLWGSIGFSVGACLGAVMGAEEIDKKKRVILFVGDGSLQLTVQEISTMIKWGVNPYIVVLNNDGYTIERLIHGPESSYNDVQSWDHTAILPTFGAKKYVSEKVSTTGELDKFLNDKKFAEPTKIRLLEVMLEKFDAPANLVKQAELSAATNAE